jgi:hypothetical protein
LRSGSAPEKLSKRTDSSVILFRFEPGYFEYFKQTSTACALSGSLYCRDMAYPNSDLSSVSGPGLFYVNSKITNPVISPEVFTTWYEDVHIPDIFESRTISNAFRFYSTKPDLVERPYLALYPMKDVALLQSKDFKSIPVHSKILPNDGRIFEFADFDTRYYLHERTHYKEPRAGKSTNT